METGDLIIEAPRRVVRRKPAQERDLFIDLRGMANGFASAHFKEWFNIYKDGRVNQMLNEAVNNEDPHYTPLKDYDEFVEDLFGRWEEPNCFNFYKHYKVAIDRHCISIAEFIKLWNECSKWFSVSLKVDDLMLTNEEEAWNNIIYWVFNKACYDEWLDAFKDEFNDRLNEYKDSLYRVSRITCGVCYENKILYTGCSCCNNNYLCQSCYGNVGNECPFCRSEMIKPFGLTDKPFEFGHWYCVMSNDVLPDIKSFVLNPVMDTCEKCNKELRWRDKTGIISEEIEYIGDGRWLTHDKIVCLDCCKCDCKEKGYIYCPRCSK